MAHTTLASTDRALEKIGDFVAAQDYASLKAVGRTFAQKAAVLVGLRRDLGRQRHDDLLAAGALAFEAVHEARRFFQVARWAWVCWSQNSAMSRRQTFSNRVRA